VKQLLAVLLCTVLPLSAFAGDASYEVTHHGNSSPDIKVETRLHLLTPQDKVRFVSGRHGRSLVRAH
jgi:hypothetical protein